MTRSAVGLGIAVAYVALTPLMLQNPMRPLLHGALGALQVVDLLAPVMASWLVWNLLARGRSDLTLNLAGDGRLPAVAAAAAGFLAACIASGAGADYSANLLGIAKYAYLVLVVLFFQTALDSPATVRSVLKAVVYATLVYMVLSIAAYLAAFFFGLASPLADIREDFPYIGRVVRLIGPMTPTAKVFGAYLLFFVLLLLLGARYIERRVRRAGLVLTAVCGVLTLGRVGFVASAAALFAIAWFHPARRALVPVLVLLAIASGLAIQAVTVWHLEPRDVSVDCDAPYAIDRQTQYFGWYEKPRMCRIAGGADLTYSSYFLMKLVAFKAWLSNPLLGVGVQRYAEYWAHAAGTLIPAYYATHIFPMAQSTYMTLLAETGLLGLAAWGILIGIFLRRIWLRLRQERTVRGAYIAWLSCFLYAMIDLDVHNFRFVYYLLPLAVALTWLANIESNPYRTQGTAAPPDPRVGIQVG